MSGMYNTGAFSNDWNPWFNSTSDPLTLVSYAGFAWLIFQTLVSPVFPNLYYMCTTLGILLIMSPPLS